MACEGMGTYSPWRLFVNVEGWAGKQGNRRIVFFDCCSNWWLHGRIRVKNGQKESVSFKDVQGAKESG